MFVKLSRILSRTSSPEELMPALVAAAVEEVGADAAAIVEMRSGGGAKVVASENVPEIAAAWHSEGETIDADLGERMRRACGERFATVHTLPLASGHELFGALVLFFVTAADPNTSRIELAEGMAAFAGLAIANAFQFEELRRSYREVRTSRETLERTQKLRALGEMAAGVSHDLKNILNPISLHLQLLKRSLKRGGEGADEAIDEMEQIVRRGVETCDRLREFSRQAPESKVEPVDPNAIAREAIGLCRPRISSQVHTAGVEITPLLGAPPPVLARPAELVAALVNLIANAIDALAEAEGGTIVVATGGEAELGWIRVTDNGRGIPEELEHRVFEPFFTTKGPEGTGLGLAMAYAFAQRHGGKLTLEKTPGGGATFTLALPAVIS